MDNEDINSQLEKLKRRIDYNKIGRASCRERV